MTDLLTTLSNHFVKLRRGVTWQCTSPSAEGIPLGSSVICVGWSAGCLLVEQSVVVEIKSVSSIEPIHEAQLLTYLKLGGWKLGLLVNFNVPALKEGIRRRIL